MVGRRALSQEEMIGGRDFNKSRGWVAAVDYEEMMGGRGLAGGNGGPGV